MRIIVPKGAPRSSGATSTTTNTNNNTGPPDEHRALNSPYDPAYTSTISSSVSIPHTNSRNARTSPPYELGHNYSREPGEAPRRRKQTKKHKSTSPNSTTSTTDLDSGYNSSDEHGGSRPPNPATSCGQGFIEEVS
jgi:hypothetical protein